MDVNLVKEYLSYDPESGLLIWIKSPGDKKTVGSPAGYVAQSGYVMVGLVNKEYRAHRLAWVLQTGELPPKFLDHKNGQRDDNRWDNLRPATKQQNTRNRVKRKDCSSIYKGVSWHKKADKWRSYASVNGQYIHLGNFDSEIEAAKSYDNFVIRTFGEFAKPNFMEELNDCKYC